MSRVLRSIVILTLAGAAVVGAAPRSGHAVTLAAKAPAGVSITPLPPLSRNTSPSIWIVQRSNDQVYGSYTYPYDFAFSDRIAGAAFKPGEHVTITVKNVSSPPVAVTANASGSFTAEMDFTWRFCGPSAARQPAPLFTAAGNQGSSAQVAEYSPPCPELVPLVTVRPLPAGGSGTAGGTGRATSGGNRAPGNPGGAVPIVTPRLIPFTVEGYGFVPFENVTVQAIGYGSYPPTPAVHVTADSLGRIRFAFSTYLPLPCGYVRVFPMLVATGDKGTSVVGRLFWYEPMLMMCPVHSAPITSQPGPAAPAAGVGGQTGNHVLGLSVHPSVARPGAPESAVVQSAGAGTIRLAVHYPGNRRSTLSAHAAAGKRTVLRWRIPAATPAGQAQVRLSFTPGNISLQTSFSIRR